MRHRGLDLHRHLVAPNLEGHRTDGRLVSRTRSVLQILHAPPSLPCLVVVGNKLRPHLGDVKRGTTTSCGARRKEHDIVCNYSLLQQLRRTSAAGSGRRFSASVPPLIRQFSTAFPQGFAQVPPSTFLRKSACFTHDLRRIFVGEINIDRKLIFISFFVRFPRDGSGLSRRKNGRKCSGIRICGKVGRSRKGGTRCWGREGGCTHNVARGTIFRGDPDRAGLNNRRWRRRRRTSHRPLPVAPPVSARSAAVARSAWQRSRRGRRSA